ncbi:MAG TPA: LamG domain-containing protein [Gemmataceae bacterium]|nr:LamG domain-containing protein [Gemmataceae bacterium]
METKLTCPGCQRSLRIPEAAQGKRIRCRCGQILTAAPTAGPEVPPVVFPIRVKHDPEEALTGVYRAEAHAHGLDWRRPKTPAIHVDRGTPARYLGKNQLALTLGSREITVMVGQLNMYNARLAHDLADFLEDDQVILKAQDYKIPWYLLVAAVLPIGILATGILGGALGGALAGCLAGGLIGANLAIIRREAWPLAGRLGAALGVSAVGYAVLIGVLLLAWPRQPQTPAASATEAQAQALPFEDVQEPATPQPAFATGPFGQPERKTPPPATVLPGLVAYWSFDEGRSQVTDHSGHGHDGKLIGATATPGIRGQAVRLHGAGFFDYGDADAFNIAKNQSFTVAGWVQTTATNGPILSQRNAEHEAPVIDITLENGTLNGVVRQDGTALLPIKLWTVRPVNDGRWHHFALVRTGGHILELYLDGQRQRFVQGNFFAGPITTNLRSAGSERYWAAHGGGSPVYFTGALDELCIFNRDLGLHEIQRLAGRKD